jgi:hypothetical protein
MHRTLVIVGILLVAILLVLEGCSPSPTPTPTHAPSPVPASSPPLASSTTPTLTTTPAPALTPTPIPTPRPKPNIVLPAGTGAFWGKVVWGDKAVVDGTVIADTKPPVVVVPPWESYSAKYKKFRVNTDNDGNYVLIVEPNEYYIGGTLPDSDYITYKTSGFVSGLFGARSHKVGSGETIQIDLESNDWSIALLSPGSTYTQFDKDRLGNTLGTNTPILTWQKYDWIRYDGKVGYYKVELGIIKDGYHVVLTGSTDKPTYSVNNPLEKGEYNWDIRAFSSSGKEIAGSIEEFYFIIP